MGARFWRMRSSNFLMMRGKEVIGMDRFMMHRWREQWHFMMSFIVMIRRDFFIVRIKKRVVCILHAPRCWIPPQDLKNMMVIITLDVWEEGMRHPLDLNGMGGMCTCLSRWYWLC